MKPSSTDDVFDLMDAYVVSAALNAAMELGLFWLLDERPRETSDIAHVLDIPIKRCQYWLQLLSEVGLLDQGSAGYVPSRIAQTAILDAFSQETWAYLAGGIHERYQGLHNLSRKLSEVKSAKAVDASSPDDYLTKMSQDAKHARDFTRMLYEIHVPLAEAVADVLDLRGIERLMDLGGGSGGISMALLHKYPQVTAMVIDIENVCVAGREIAAERGITDRISYLAADFLQDELPSDFDMALLCDLGIYHPDLYNKIREVLNPGGRLVIVDQLAPSSGFAPSAWLDWTFVASLDDPSFAHPTVSEVQHMLQEAGFQTIQVHNLPESGIRRWSKDWILLEAQVEPISE